MKSKFIELPDNRVVRKDIVTKIEIVPARHSVLDGIRKPFVAVCCSGGPPMQIICDDDASCIAMAGQLRAELFQPEETWDPENNPAQKDRQEYDYAKALSKADENRNILAGALKTAVHALHTLTPRQRNAAGISAGTMEYLDHICDV